MNIIIKQVHQGWQKKTVVFNGEIFETGEEADDYKDKGMDLINR